MNDRFVSVSTATGSRIRGCFSKPRCDFSVTRGWQQMTNAIKGELNLDNKWQSDDLFYIIMNKIHPRFNQFCVILKLS